MGYSIQLQEAAFRIEAEDTRDALATIKDLMTDLSAERGGYRSQGDDHFAYMNGVDPEEWDYLKEAMRDWRFPVELDDDLNVVDIRFVGENVGDEKQMFESIASFVQDGSYIEFVGADGERFRYVFKEDTMEQQNAEVSF